MEEIMFRADIFYKSLKIFENHNLAIFPHCLNLMLPNEPCREPGFDIITTLVHNRAGTACRDVDVGVSVLRQSRSSLEPAYATPGNAWIWILAKKERKKQAQVKAQFRLEQRKKDVVHGLLSFIGTASKHGHLKRYGAQKATCVNPRCPQCLVMQALHHAGHNSLIRSETNPLVCVRTTLQLGY